VQATGFSLSLGRPEGRPLQQHEHRGLCEFCVHRCVDRRAVGEAAEL